MFEEREESKQNTSDHLIDHDIPTNTFQVLVKGNIKTLTELRSKTEDELCNLPGMNAEKMRQIKKFLDAH